jgi:hypothetical protein
MTRDLVGEGGRDQIIQAFTEDLEICPDSQQKPWWDFSRAMTFFHRPTVVGNAASWMLPCLTTASSLEAP